MSSQTCSSFEVDTPVTVLLQADFARTWKEAPVSASSDFWMHIESEKDDGYIWKQGKLTCMVRDERSVLALLWLYGTRRVSG